MYICICKAVTDNHIRQAAAEGVNSIRDLRQQLGVATGCGKCGRDAKRVLRDALSESQQLATAEVAIP